LSWKNQKKRKLVRYIQQKVVDVSFSLLARLFHLSRKTLYQKENAKPFFEDELLREQILAVLEKHKSYGHRRIALELHIGKKRIRRVMKRYGIKPYKRKARWRKRRDERREPQPYPNLIKGICPIRPGMILVGDFTHLIYQGKILYLATYMDLCTREIVGWYISNKHTKELVLEALLDALKTLGKLPLIIHTDQGSEYCSKENIGFLTSMGIQISMSKKASPWENGYQESFYDNFKTDLGLEFDRFETLGEFIAGIHETINYYNKERIHTSLKMSPRQFRHRIQMS
jgi:transposase InsO family protein